MRDKYGINRVLKTVTTLHPYHRHLDVGSTRVDFGARGPKTSGNSYPSVGADRMRTDGYGRAGDDRPSPRGFGDFAEFCEALS